MATLLPPNSTKQERAIAAATARIGTLSIPLRQLWNADTCPVDKLAWLAWAFGAEEWDENWSEEAKRNTIRESLLVQRRKGSVWSIRRALSNAGFGSAQIVEGIYGRTYDGAAAYNGLEAHGDPTQWATYRIILDRPIANKQADQIRRILHYTAPVRCKLIDFIYTQAANLYDNAIRYNGTYNHGTV